MTSQFNEQPLESGTPQSRRGSRRRVRRTGESSEVKTRGAWRKYRRYILAGLIVVLCLFFFPRVRALVAGRDPVQGAKAGTMAKKSTHDINILLLGVDERNGDRGRSDTMMLLNYNAVWGTLHLMSIPRDTRVSLPGHGNQKINAAYAYGGPDLAKQAVGQLTGLYVDYYMKVNFNGFSGVVDALGGVDINVKQRMYYKDPYQNLVIDFKPGLQHMNGDQALEYVRWRGDASADLGRVQRQRDFLNAAMGKALNPLSSYRIPGLLIALARCTDTDIPVLMRPGITSSVSLAYLKGVQTATMPGTTATIGDGSYVLADRGALDKIVASWSARPVKPAKTGEAKGETGTP